MEGRFDTLDGVGALPPFMPTDPGGGRKSVFLNEENCFPITSERPSARSTNLKNIKRIVIIIIVGMSMTIFFSNARASSIALVYS